MARIALDIDGDLGTGFQPMLIADGLVDPDAVASIAKRPCRRAELMAEDAANDRDPHPATAKLGHDAGGSDHMAVSV